MYCIKCGKRLRPEQNYCDRCGTYLGEIKQIRKSSKANEINRKNETDKVSDHLESKRESTRDLYLIDLESDRKQATQNTKIGTGTTKLRVYEKSRNQSPESEAEEEQKPRQSKKSTAKQKRDAAKKRRLLIGLFLILIVFAGLFGYLIYRNTSYVPGSRMIGTTQETPDEYVFGNQDYLRSEIIKVEFSDDLNMAEDDAWDISIYRDQSVLAWIEKKESGQVLFIAGENGVRADDCSSMFANYTSLTTVKFNDVFYTAMCRDFSDMFFECESLSEADLSCFDTRNAIDMEGMFFGCSSLTELRLSSFSTRKVQNFSYMFADCSSLTNLDLRGFRTDSAVEAAAMYFGCSSLKEVTGEPEFDAQVITDDIYADSRIGEAL